MTSMEARVKKSGGLGEGDADDSVGEELDAEIAGVDVEGEAIRLAVHLHRRSGSR